MSSQPYLRAADDGTYELLVPFGKGSVHILPYCFHTEEDAANWLASRKGREHIQRIRPMVKKQERISRLYTPQTKRAVATCPKTGGHDPELTRLPFRLKGKVG